MNRELARRIRNLIRRGTVKQTTDSTGEQTLQYQGLAGETRDDVEHIQTYGFTSRAQNDSECVVIFPGGDHGAGVALNVGDRRYRVKGLKNGEVCVYTDEGDTIILKRGNEIELKSKNKITADVGDGVSKITMTPESITLESPKVEIKANEIILNASSLSMAGQGGGDTAGTIQGTMTATNDLQANGGAVSLRGHVHSGIQPGASNTESPVGG